MKSLDQIEPRTPISSVPFIISASGSYYLTKNLNVTTGDAITIAADNVTLDLNGFTISSTANPAAGTGILIGSGLNGITILNGHVKGGVTYNGTYSGPGFANGINDSLPNSCTARITGISVTGCATNGIYLLSGGDTSTIDGCTALTIGSQGLCAGTVSNSTAYDCGGPAILASKAFNCRGQSNGAATAVSATNASHCEGRSSGGRGVSGSIVENCFGASSGTGTGINAGAASNSYGESDNGPGINAVSASNCRGYSSAGGQGINATNAINCYGSSQSGTGLSANNASTCYGQSSGSGTGLFANNASTCYGLSSNGTGLSTNNTAIGCYGYSSGGIGLSAYIANSCRGETSTGTAQSITFKYNMP